eukprot:6211864-Pleurochrysis_carterae.AAC.1
MGSRIGGKENGPDWTGAESRNAEPGEEERVRKGGGRRGKPTRGMTWDGQSCARRITHLCGFDGRGEGAFKLAQVGEQDCRNEGQPHRLHTVVRDSKCKLHIRRGAEAGRCDDGLNQGNT